MKPLISLIEKDGDASKPLILRVSVTSVTIHFPRKVKKTSYLCGQRHPTNKKSKSRFGEEYIYDGGLFVGNGLLPSIMSRVTPTA
jgi:hypothetical protein